MGGYNYSKEKERKTNRGIEADKQTKRDRDRFWLLRGFLVEGYVYSKRNFKTFKNGIDQQKNYESLAENEMSLYTLT